jgi:hypothetical protein
MRIFKGKVFYHWAKDVGLTDNKLKEAINEIKDGLYEANLGGNIFKKRVSLFGRGKSGGVRTIIAFKADKHIFFIYGFAKNERSNISEKEELALKKLAKLYFSFNDVQLVKAVHSGELFEVK